MTHTPNALRRYRKAAGYSQTEIAGILKLRDASSISRWELGQRVPDITRLLELSCLYHRLVNDLMRPQYLDARERIHDRLHTLDPNGA